MRSSSSSVTVPSLIYLYCIVRTERPDFHKTSGIGGQYLRRIFHFVVGVPKAHVENVCPRIRTHELMRNHRCSTSDRFQVFPMLVVLCRMDCTVSTLASLSPSACGTVRCFLLEEGSHLKKKSPWIAALCNILCEESCTYDMCFAEERLLKEQSGTRKGGEDDTEADKGMITFLHFLIFSKSRTI